MTAYSADLAEQNLLHRQLMDALDAWCACRADDGGAVVEQCGLHAALADPDHRFEKHLGFGRFLAARCVAEEFTVRQAA